MDDLINWNNAPEWADLHGVVGTSRDPIWFNGTRYAYCETPDRIMQLNTTGVTPPYNWEPSDIQNVTMRPTTAYSVDWNDAPDWATHHGYRGPEEFGYWFGNGKYLRVGHPTYETMNDPTGEVTFHSTTKLPKLAEAMTQYSPRASKIYYIAGPMSGLPNFNRDAFNAAATKLTYAGHTVLNPATLPDGLSQAQYMDICLAMLRCATHVQMLRGWDDSRGALAERALALKLGLTVEYV